MCKNKKTNQKEVLLPREEFDLLSNKTGSKLKEPSDELKKDSTPKRGDEWDNL